MIQNELYHHGILGQKWGKRNGPPYPLGADDHSAREKRMAKSSSPRSSVHVTNKASVKRESDVESRKLSLTDTQKKALKIGAIAVGSALVVGGTIYLTKTGKLNTIIQKGEKVLSDVKSGSGFSKEFVNIPGVKAIAEQHNMFQDLLAVNPYNDQNNYKPNEFILVDRNSKKPLHELNCQACSLGYELRRRGYDAIARLIDTRSTSDVTNLQKFYKNPNIVTRTISSTDQVAEYIKESQTVGTRGVLTIPINYGIGSHALSYEVLNEGVMFMDAQCGKPFINNTRPFNEFYEMPKNSKIMFARTDNLELNDLDYIKQFLTSIIS